MRAFEVDPSEVRTEALQFNEAARRLVDGTLDAMFDTAIYPTSAVGLSVAGWGPAHPARWSASIDELRHEYPFFRAAVIPRVRILGDGSRSDDRCRPFLIAGATWTRISSTISREGSLMRFRRCRCHAARCDSWDLDEGQLHRFPSTKEWRGDTAPANCSDEPAEEARRPAPAVWLAVGLCSAVLVLILFGYRATRESRHQSELLVERRSNEAAELLVTALTRDMRAVQRSVLSSNEFDASRLDSPYGVTLFRCERVCQIPVTPNHSSPVAVP